LEGGFGWVKQIGGWEALVGAFFTADTPPLCNFGFLKLKRCQQTPCLSWSELTKSMFFPQNVIVGKQQANIHCFCPMRVPDRMRPG
jgi:hypothetical protein